MKSKLLFLLLLVFQYHSFAQVNQVTLDYSTTEESQFELLLNDYKLVHSDKSRPDSFVIKAKGLSPILEAGVPDLPRFSESLIIPGAAHMQAEIKDAEYVEINDVTILPSKGNLKRTVNPKDVAYTFGPMYQENAFFPANLIDMEEPYIIRDFRGLTIHVSPFQYNPVTKVLRVYTKLKVRVFSQGTDTVNVLSNAYTNKVDSDFAQIYARHFINYRALFTPLTEEGNMLIICHDAWMSQVQPLVDWKNTIGRPTTMIPASQAGGTAAGIKSYVTNYYNTNGLSYLLLIGDSAQIPANNYAGLGGDSDNAYAYISGNDHYQEFFVGRFSAETPTQVVTQVQRTIEYERGDQLTEGFLDKVMSVASQEGPGDDGELDYQHLRNIQPDLLGFTYINPVFELFEGSQGGFDAPGFPNVAQAAAAINSGVGVINYVGHGSDGGWATTGFSTNNALALQNQNRLPFVFNVACVNGNFVGQTCFAEGWLRAQYNGEPTGAVAMNASTINQSWSPPMIGQDEMNDILTEISTVGVRRTFGGITVNGYFKMNEESGDFDMTDTWTCFGDPSLLVRTANPSTMLVNHNSVHVVGQGTFSVNGNVDNALATLSSNGEIIGSAFVSGGIASIPVSGVVPGQTLTLAVTGFNQVTYISEVTAIAPNGPYLLVDQFEDSIEYGQAKNINISLKNIGVVAAANATTQMSTTDTQGVLTNSSFVFGTVNANQSTGMSTNSFLLTVNNDIIDQYSFPVQVQISDGNGGTYTENRTVTVNAPSFKVNEINVLEVSGNGNSLPDPGETCTIQATVINQGHATVQNIIGQIIHNNPYLQFTNNTATHNTMLVDGSHVFSFEVVISPTTPQGTLVNFDFKVNGGISGQYQKVEPKSFIVGFVPEYCIPEVGNTEDEFIAHVQIGTIDNTSGPSSYTDFSSINTTVALGQSYPVQVTNGEHWDGDNIICWADWNYDGDFDDTNEEIVMVYQNVGDVGLASGTITVPQSAHIGNVRFRVRLFFADSTLPCEAQGYGETEDYTLVVQSQLDTDESKILNFSLWPNPSSGTFQVQFGSESSELNNKIEVFNSLGQLVYKDQNPQRETQFNLQEASGVYFVKVIWDGAVSTKKIIIR